MLLLVAIALPAAAATTANHDSCDIGVYPAATLLLPYFEVDIKSAVSTAHTTLFTITNSSALPQVAHVVIWTDWSFPALGFNVFLTGYDVQPINLHDVLARGIIAPGPTDALPGSATPVPTNPTSGSQPAANNANPNFLPSASVDCGPGLLPGPIPPHLLADLQSILTTGKSSGAAIAACAGTQVGGVHANAIGYITIDVASTCHTSLPTEARYFTDFLLYDNVLIGDYEQVTSEGSQQFASGGPMVHIRAVPEGGAAGSTAAAVLPYTFYDRFTTGTPNRISDRRQPLPSAFIARYIEGEGGGFVTNMKIWREGIASGACDRYSANASIPQVEIVRFDEHENATTFFSGICVGVTCNGYPSPVTSSMDTQQSGFFPPSFFPPTWSRDAGGWMYLNLDSLKAGSRHSQNWVLSSMAANPSFAVDIQAAALGNGCSPAPAAGAQIGPSP